MSRTRAFTASACLLGSLLWSCGSDGAPSTTAEADASTPSEGDAADYRGCEGLAPFELGMQATSDGGELRAELLAATPAPPARYRNDWTVQLRAADGSVLADGAITHARTFMPLHGHDGGIVPVITSLKEPGQVRIERLNLSMRGAWEIQLTVSAPGVGEDRIVFHVCAVE